MDNKIFKGYIVTDSEGFKAKIDDTTGFLTAPVKLARTGVQHYMGFELGLTGDDALRKIGVLRHPDDVFHTDSVKSFVNLVVTDDHPDNLVTIENVKTLQTGQVSDVKKMSSTLDGVVTITDKGQIEKIKSGKSEVSVGYTNDLIQEKGSYDGIDYEYRQTNIRANHLAIVGAGRCGASCRITTDNKKEINSVKIKINGIVYDTKDEVLAQAIEKQLSTHDDEMKAMKSKVKEAEEKAEDMEKEKDKAEAAKDAALKTVLSDDDINKMVSDRAELISTATMILGDKMPECVDCPKEIMTAVIDKVLDIGDLSGKSMEYVQASYDIAVKKAETAKDTIDNINQDFKDKEGKTVTRDSARNEYMKSIGLEVN